MREKIQEWSDQGAEALLLGAVTHGNKEQPKLMPPGSERSGELQATNPYIPEYSPDEVRRVAEQMRQYYGISSDSASTISSDSASTGRALNLEVD